MHGRNEHLNYLLVKLNIVMLRWTIISIFLYTSVTSETYGDQPLPCLWPLLQAYGHARVTLFIHNITYVNIIVWLKLRSYNKLLVDSSNGLW